MDKVAKLESLNQKVAKLEAKTTNLESKVKAGSIKDQLISQSAKNSKHLADLNIHFKIVPINEVLPEGWQLATIDHALIYRDLVRGMLEPRQVVTVQGGNLFGSFYGPESFYKTCWGTTCFTEGGQWALIIPKDLSKSLADRVPFMPIDLHKKQIPKPSV